MAESEPNVDEILEDALREFEEDDVGPQVEVATAAARATAAVAAATSTAGVTSAVHSADAGGAGPLAGGGGAEGGDSDMFSDAALREALERVLGELKDPAFQASLREAMQGMGSPDATTPSSGGGSGGPGLNAEDAAVARLFSSLIPQGASGGGGDTDSLTKAMAMLSMMGGDGHAGANTSTPTPSTPSGSPGPNQSPSDTMTRLMAEFERMGGSDDFSAALESTMKELLSKDVMYGPIKEITDKFPEWLGKNRDTLPSDEYDKYGRQYQCFQRLVQVYETDAANFGRVSVLMQELQEYGNPPADIIRDLAPGLEFGPDGTPILPGLGAAMPPWPSGAMGGPNLSGTGEGGAGVPPPGCTIM